MDMVMGKMEDKVCMVCIPMGRNNGKNCQCWGKMWRRLDFLTIFPLFPPSIILYTQTPLLHTAAPWSFTELEMPRKELWSGSGSGSPPNSASAAFVQDAPKLSHLD